MFLVLKVTWRRGGRAGGPERAGSPTWRSRVWVKATRVVCERGPPRAFPPSCVSRATEGRGVMDWPGQAGGGPAEDRRTAGEVSGLPSSAKRSGVGWLHPGGRALGTAWCAPRGAVSGVRYVVSIVCGSSSSPEKKVKKKKEGRADSRCISEAPSRAFALAALPGVDGSGRRLSFDASDSGPSCSRAPA